MTSRPLRLAVWLILGLLPARALSAQPFPTPPQIVLRLDLNAWAFRLTGPIVNSCANAELFGSEGRIYDQIILGHELRDVVYNSYRFQNRVESPNGYASSRTGNLDAENYNSCFLATAAGHANAYSLH